MGSHADRGVALDLGGDGQLLIARHRVGCLVAARLGRSSPALTAARPLTAEHGIREMKKWGQNLHPVHLVDRIAQWPVYPASPCLVTSTM
ncbi:hypothetical protein FQZ97_725540 [compost metagenome]